eukprot:g2794.t1
MPVVNKTEVDAAQVKADVQDGSKGSGDVRLQESANARLAAATIAATGSAEFTAAARSAKKGAPSADDAKKEFKMTEHTLAGDCTKEGGKKLWQQLQLPGDFDPEQGLPTSFVEKRQAEEGPNALTPPPQESELIKFLKCLFNFFACLLWAGAVLCLSVMQESPDSVHAAVDIAHAYLHHAVALPSSGTADDKSDSDTDNEMPGLCSSSDSELHPGGP